MGEWGILNLQELQESIGWASESVWTRGGGERKNPMSCRKSNPGRPAGSLLTTFTELSHLFCSIWLL